MSLYFFAKSLHIIGFISWFAALFYLPRLFIYHAEANEKKSNEEKKVLKPQFEIMERRLYGIIMNPAMVITWLGGITMLFINDLLLLQIWLQVKLVLLILLTVFHFYCKSIMKKLRNDANSLTSEQLRGVNEIPTMLMVAIVFLAVFKNILHFGYAFAGLVAFGFLLFLGIKLYKRNRERAERNV